VTSNDDHFVTVWRMPATRGTAQAVDQLGDADDDAPGAFDAGAAD
jgi:hypothetical protein